MHGQASTREEAARSDSAANAKICNTCTGMDSLVSQIWRLASGFASRWGQLTGSLLGAPRPPLVFARGRQRPPEGLALGIGYAEAGQRTFV